MSMTWGLALAASLAVLCATVGGVQSTHADLPAATVPQPRNMATLTDPVAELARRLTAQKAQLAYDDRFGFLPAVLRELSILSSSQTLVFSKTSLQSRLISPLTPRAIYFSDTTYVGFIPNAPLLEIATVDPKVGVVFYTIAQSPGARPRLVTNADCVQCHATAATAGIPGLLLRSVFARPDGQMAQDTRGFLTDHASPFRDRWGGWYVTGKVSAAVHMGNSFVRQGDGQMSFERGGATVASTGAQINRDRYLETGSDVVALLVLGHQVQMHSLIGQLRDLANRREPFDAAVDAIVRYALFADEAELPGPVTGSSTFTRDFEQLGPRDRAGRSLRQFDLRTRLFRIPVSFLLYADEFRGLPSPARTAVLARLEEVLSGRDRSDAFGRLSAVDRAAARAMLIETLPIFAAHARP